MKTFSCKNKKTNHELKKTADFLRVISEENRLLLLCLLKKGEMCVCEIWQYLDLPQNLTSYHLKALKDFGLINDRKEGLKVYYSINKKELTKFNSLLNKFLQSYGK
jgi:ArsR family transcriptional regulator